MNTAIKNIFFRTLLCTVLLFVWAGTAQAQDEYNYTIYFNDVAGWGNITAKVFHNWNEDNLIIEESMSYDETTGYYVLTFTTSYDDSYMSAYGLVSFWGESGDGIYWEAFENGKVYSYEPGTGTWTFNPEDKAGGLTDLSGFTVTYSSGLSINEDATDQTIRVTCDGVEVSDVYVQAGTIGDDNSITFTFVDSQGNPVSFDAEGTYVIIIPEGYFNLEADGTTSNALILTYTIGDPAEYTIYFDTSLEGGWSETGKSGPDNNYFYLYVQVYYVDYYGNTIYCTTGNDGAGNPNWDTFTWTGTDCLYSWSYTGYIPEGAKCVIKDSWGNITDFDERDFVNGATYYVNSGHGVSIVSGAWTFDPESKTTLDELGSFTVKYSGGLSINKDAPDQTVKVVYTTYTGVSYFYAQAGTIVDATSMTFTFVDNDGNPVTFEDEGTYAIIIPEGYFNLGDVGTTSDAITLFYTIGEPTEYAIHFDYNIFGGWHSSSATTVYVQVYYTDDYGNTMYLTTGSDSDGNSNWDKINARWSYTGCIPEGAKCVFKDTQGIITNFDERDFVNGAYYYVKGMTFSAWGYREEMSAGKLYLTEDHYGGLSIRSARGVRLFCNGVEENTDFSIQLGQIVDGCSITFTYAPSDDTTFSYNDIHTIVFPAGYFFLEDGKTPCDEVLVRNINLSRKNLSQWFTYPADKTMGLEKLSQFTRAYLTGFRINEDAPDQTIRVTYNGAEVPGVFVQAGEMTDWFSMTFTFVDNDGNPVTFEDEGVYTIIFPAGYFTTSGSYTVTTSDTIILTYTIGEGNEYTIYFDTSLDGGSYANGKLSGSNCIYVQVYYTDDYGNTMYLTTGSDSDGNPNWDTFAWTGTDCLYSWSYTGYIPEGAKCVIKDMSGKITYTGEYDFVNGAVYSANGMAGTGTWIFNPVNWESGLDELGSFTVKYSGGLSINEDATDQTIRVTCDGVEVSDVYVQAGTIGDDNSITFTFVDSQGNPVSFDAEGTYVIIIPEGYFNLGDVGTTSEEISLSYTIGEGNEYTIYFDTSLDGGSYANGSLSSGNYIYVQVYYTDDYGNTKYFTSGNDGDGNPNWDVFTWTGTDYLYSWTYTGYIPEGAKCVIKDRSGNITNTDEYDFVNGATYYVSGMLLGAWTFDPESKTTLDELGSFTVKYSAGLGINEDATDQIRITCNGVEISGVSVQAGNIIDGNSVTFTFVDSQSGNEKTFDTDGTYVIIIPEGYFNLEADGTTSNALILTYTIGDPAEYTIYFDTSLEGGWSETGKSGPDNNYFYLYVQVYYVDYYGNTIYCTTGSDSDGNPNWDTFAWTGTDCLYSWSYTGYIPEGAKCVIKDSWGNITDFDERDFVNGATYYVNSGHGVSIVSGDWTFSPENGESGLDDLTEFTVTYSGGLSINEGVADDNTIRVTCNGVEVPDVYVQAGTIGDDNSMTFTFVDSQGNTTSLTTEGTYAIIIPEGYFNLGDVGTTSDAITLFYTIGEPTEYTIYFDTSLDGGWGEVDGSNGFVIYVQVYYTDDYGNTIYCTTGSDSDGNSNWDVFSWTGTDCLFSWTYTGYIPEGAKCVIKDSWGNITDFDERDFVNGATYTVNVNEGDGGGDIGGEGSSLTYKSTYNEMDISTVKIVHKQPKWCGMSDVSHDTFNPEGWTYTENNIEIQAANIYVDTLYMLKGDDIELVLPYSYGAAMSTTSFQRWFDCRTDGNYRYGEEDDLLMPLMEENGFTVDYGWNEIYRFENGYVCGLSIDKSFPLLSATFHYPTDNEYAAFSDTYFSKDDRDNDYYVVACDVSIYNDCEDFGKLVGDSYNWTEPTLAGRAIYYIVGIDPDDAGTTAPSGLPDKFQAMWKLLDTDYQGGTNNGGEKYLEEYEITYPARRTSNHTLELVTLSKDARAYVVPGQSDTSTELTVKFDGQDNEWVADSNGFMVVAYDYVYNDETEEYDLQVPVLRDQNRVMHFYNTGGDPNDTTAVAGAPWSVPDGTTATILVTKEVNDITYNIARYKLTFKDNATPLTQTQVAGLDTIDVNNGKYWWKDMTYRSPNYMKRNYDNVASLTFDYGSYSSDAETVLNGQSGFHAFPMDWENTSYAFYDGSTGDDVKSEGYPWYDTDATEGTPTRRIYTQWCMYSIVNDYFGYGDSKYMTSTNDSTYTGNDNRQTEKPGGTNDYWLYIDASDRPGSVAEISFDEDLCVGSEIFGTVLIKSASESTSDDAGVMLTIMGVSVDDDGNEVHTPIYRQCSSQIRFTTYINTGDSWDVDEENLPSYVTGKGEGTNEWFQLYFSFYNTANDLSYDHYALKIDNYCSSTTGGDYYIDNIQLYIAQPTFMVEQIEPVCTASDEAAAMRLEVDFDMLEARLGDDPTTDVDDAVDFMIINTNTYNNYLAGHPSDDPEDSEANKAAIATAIEAATVAFVYEEDGEQKTANYITLKFNETYSNNEEYDTDNPGSNTPENYDGSDYFYGYTVNGEEYLAIDCYADISPYTPYKILLLQDNNTLTAGTYAEFFADCIYDDCEIASDFYLTSSTILKINGEAADPTVDYCAGQTVVIQPEVTYTDDNGNTVMVEGEYFDWFFGTEEEYTAVNAEFNGVTLEQALLMFRNFYPTATELSATDTPVTGDDAETDFTQDMYDIIEYYLSMPCESSYHAKLVLYKQYFDVVIPTSELDLVVQPIEVTVYEYDNDGYPIEDGESNPEVVADVCFGYVPLTLGMNGSAPTFNAGFHNVEYPGDDFVPSIRLGLSQVTQASQAKSGSDTQTPIYINLRNASYYYEDGSSTTEADHLGVYTREDGTMDGLYLVGTDDPAYEEALSDEYFLQYDLPIGKVLELYAIENDEKGESYMKIAFYDEYTLREGYTYIVMVNCEEKDQYGASVNGVCQGTLPIELKIVPEYLVWTGDSTSNWNNDSHWQRVSSTSINGTITDNNAPYFTDGTNANTNGFVPMLFSKVVIPADGMACLYPAGFALDTDKLYKWTENSVTPESVTESLRDSIMYDLMVYNTEDGQGNIESMKTERYRVNLCRQLHLAPGAQMLHSELLLVDTVWTEVKIPQGEWQLASTPLNSVYSGDWYTKTSGTETTEYFKDINWNDDDNNRYDPDIYQRSWDKAGNIIVSTTDSKTSPDDREAPVYVSTGWTSAYNDASVEYNPGVGFSLEGWSGATASTDSIMFRFPKADTQYAYSSSTGVLDRSNTGTLLISGLVDRTDPDKDGGDVYTGEVTVNLPENTLEGNEYYLVGNPFTAAMSMRKFMEENEDNNVAAYWAESGDGPIVGNWDGTSSGYGDYLLPPYTGFFITFEENGGPTQISFTKDMQVLADADRFGPVNFSLRATSGAGATSACVAYHDSASDGYSLVEDVPLLEDDSWMRDGMPVVYTVAGDMAVSINSLRRLVLIPVGVFADENAQYTLSFAGVSKLESPVLVDTYENTETPITEGLTLEMEGPTHGRYFIRSQGMATDIDDIEETAGDVNAVSVYSPVPHTVVVSSDAGIESVDIYSVGGMLLKRANAGGSVSCTMDGVASGIAIVRARTGEGTVVRKLPVR